MTSLKRGRERSWHEERAAPFCVTFCNEQNDSIYSHILTHNYNYLHGVYERHTVVFFEMKVIYNSIASGIRLMMPQLTDDTSKSQQKGLRHNL